MGFLRLSPVFKRTAVPTEFINLDAGDKDGEKRRTDIIGRDYSKVSNNSYRPSFLFHHGISFVGSFLRFSLFLCIQRDCYIWTDSCFGRMNALDGLLFWDKSPFGSVQILSILTIWYALVSGMAPCLSWRCRPKGDALPLISSPVGGLSPEGGTPCLSWSCHPKAPERRRHCIWTDGCFIWTTVFDGCFGRTLSEVRSNL